MERRTQLFINRANCMVHWGGNLNRGEQFYCKATEPPVGNTIQLILLIAIYFDERFHHGEFVTSQTDGWP